MKIKSRYTVVLVGKPNKFWFLFDYDMREDRISNKPIETFKTRKEAEKYAKRNNMKIMNIKK